MEKVPWNIEKVDMRIRMPSINLFFGANIACYTRSYYYLSYVIYQWISRSKFKTVYFIEAGGNQSLNMLWMCLIQVIWSAQIWNKACPTQQVSSLIHPLHFFFLLQKCQKVYIITWLCWILITSRDQLVKVYPFVDIS